MVHKKYIKRGDKIFGPYLYHNYRENGITKTRYLGKTKVRGNRNLFLIFGIAILIILILSFVGLFLSDERSSDYFGELATKSPLDFFVDLFSTTAPLNVLVEIMVSNPPVIENLDDEVFVCENRQLNYYFNVSDADGDALSISLSPSYSPTFPNIPFIYNRVGEGLYEFITEIWIGSNVILNKSNIEFKRESGEGWATYPETFTVVNEHLMVDSKDFNITIIEINNAPNLESLDSKTLWAEWPKNTLYVEANANDLETAKQDLRFNLSIEGLDVPDPDPPFFNISENGTIDFTANLSYLTCTNCSENYLVTVCTNDTGIQNPHDNMLSECPLETPGPLFDCLNFGLTITDRNTAPNIIYSYPLNTETIPADGTDDLYFNISFEDEQSIFLDVLWYAYSDAKLIKTELQNLSSELDYAFGCGVSGDHVIEAVVTDGGLNDSISWNLSVNLVECPPPLPPVSPGSSGTVYCDEKWGCGEWQQCQNLEKLVEEGWTSKETELLIKERCELFELGEGICGFQQRSCFDAKKCGTNWDKPGLIKECHYTENPTCEDRIKNCHQGYCEVLIDCGGPCNACPTCSDGIKNQDEEEIDCGGSCRPCIELPFAPRAFKLIISYSLVALLIVVLLLVFNQFRKYKGFKRVVGVKKRFEKTVGIKKRFQGGNVVVSLFFIFIVIVLLFFANMFIMNFARAGGVAAGIEAADFLASYGFINSFLRNIGVFFITGPIVSWDNNAELIIGDVSDAGGNVYNGQDFYFYADYNYVGSGLPVSTGFCRIRFEDYLSAYSNFEDMVYDGISRFEYTKISGFNYKGTYDFEVECSEDGTFVDGVSPGFVRVNEDFTIKNTPPEFIEEAYQTTYYGFEDTVLTHNFSANITEPDINEELIFDFQSINLQDVSNFPWILINSSTGLMVINATTDAQTDNFQVSVEVIDTDDEGELRDFSFNIAPVNDPPFFVELNNQTPIMDYLFEYTIIVGDEEDDVPFVYNISFLDGCSAEVARGNCTLFTDYTVLNQGRSLDISFTPSQTDVGDYLINFSVMDSSGLGDQSTSKIVNFTVKEPFWNELLNYNFSLIEDEAFYLNLSEMVTSPGLSFFMSSGGFGNFALTEANNELISFVPKDEDVGYWTVEIIATDGMANSPKDFNFNISNIPDAPNIVLIFEEILVNEGDVIPIFQNLNIDMSLPATDDDFLITQKNFYDEDLVLNWSIDGPNQSLFEFYFFSQDLRGETYFSQFKSDNPDNLGDYAITLNITDNSGLLDVFEFNLTISDNPYDVPVITHPDESVEFNFTEGVASDLIFRASHSIGSVDLVYKFYIDNVLRNITTGFGNDTDFTWQFTPDFTDETYGNKTNLTLIVENPFIPEFNAIRTWNLTINHTNHPINFSGEILNKTYPINYAVQVFDIQSHFLDIDHGDPYYNQKVEFEVLFDSPLSFISEVDENWTFVVSSDVAQTVVFNITGYDFNISDESQSLTNVTSNNFKIEFVKTEPTIVQVPVSGSVTTKKVPLALKIIMPGSISAYEGQKMDIPLTLINSGKTTFNNLNLNSSAFKQGEVVDEIKTSLDKSHFDSLKPNQEENLNLTVFFDTNKLGEYEILVNVESKSPKYKDWGKIHINLQAINESQVRELILFTKEFFAQNPQCIEITEILIEAEKSFEQGDYVDARTKTEQALDSCREAISQVSTPKIRIKSFEISLYLVIGSLFAFFIALVYYFLKRRQIRRKALGRMEKGVQKIGEIGGIKRFKI